MHLTDWKLFVNYYWYGQVHQDDKEYLTKYTIVYTVYSLENIQKIKKIRRY